MKKLFILSGIFLLWTTFSLFSEETVKIYVTYGQSYTAVENFQSAEDMKGAILAAERINEEGGILGRSVEIIDGGVTKITAGKELAIKYLEENEMTAAVGANISNITKLIGPLFQKAGVPLISPISTHPDISSLGDYIFRACFTDPFQGQIMATFALDELSAQTAVILTKAPSTFSVSLAEYFRKGFEREGTVLTEEFYNGDQSDYSEILLKVKTLDPDVVFVPGHGADAGLILKQANNMKLKATFLGGDGWGKGVLGVAGSEASEGHYFVNHWHQDEDTEQSRDFVQRYHAKYGDGPIASSAALAYDSFNIIMEAIRQSGSLVRSDIRDAMARIRNYQGVTGSFTMDFQGDPLNKSAAILTYKDGSIDFVKLIEP